VGQRTYGATETEHARHHSITGIFIMMLHRRALAVFIATALLANAGAASAQADIVQCVDATGLVTFTDAACNTAADAERASGPVQTVSGKLKTLPSAASSGAAKKVYAAKREGESMQNRRSVLDASTVSAAKVSLVALDEISALMRQQAQAQRIARAESGWTFW
jgi:hypothetical protein